MAMGYMPHANKLVKVWKEARDAGYNKQERDAVVKGSTFAKKKSLVNKLSFLSSDIENRFTVGNHMLCLEVYSTLDKMEEHVDQMMEMLK